MANASRWDREESIFHRAVELDSDGRTELLERECGSNEELRRRVEALLESDALASPVGTRVVLSWPVDLG